MKGPDGIYIANSDGTNPHQILGYANTCCVQWSPDSKHIVYFRGNLKIGGSMYTANPDGSNVTEIGAGFNPAWSPDGNRMAYANCQANSSQCGLFIIDLKTKVAQMITHDNGANPQWSPHGDRLVYQADDGKGHVNVFVVNADGTGIKQLTSGKSNDGQPVWSRDGTYILWRSDQNGAGWALFAMRADGTNPRLIINNAPASIDWGRESLTTAP
jgi:Tol biopolymer transport system component